MTLSRIPFDHADLAARHGGGWPLAVFLGLVLFVAPAQAASPEDQKCINELNKGFAKVAKTQGKDIDKCIKDGSKQKLGGLTIEECLTADRKGKVFKAKKKLSDKVGGRCATPPAFGFSDPNTANELAVVKELTLIHWIFGSDDLDEVIVKQSDPNTPNAKDTSKCQAGVAKAAKKCQDTKLKVFNKCKKDGLSGKLGTPIDSAQELQDTCMGTGPNGIPDGNKKIEKACVTKLGSTIDKKCTGVDLAGAFPGFDPNGPDLLQEWVDEIVECAFCLTLNELDGLDRVCDLFDDGVIDGNCGIACGNGVIDGDDVCDDSNTDDGDGCSSGCLVELGFDCAGEPSVCTAICGDGLVRGAEECDDNNTADGDGCSSSCLIETGFDCTAEPSVCDGICPDGLIRGSEECDDGGVANGDGCDSSCLQESGWVCQGEPSGCANTCGDGVIDSGEECDDNNTADGDGCRDN
jgi:cysteine-rich repeat protein